VSLRYDEIAEILKIIDSSSCDEFIVETGDVKLIVRRNGATGRAELLNERPPQAAAAAPQAGARAPSKAEISAGQTEVTAPMVGTFFRSPSPDAQPFVDIGSVVTKGQPLCLIEVMKLFTTIHSDIAGRVVQIGAENAELVEYGQTLFVIEPG
jgi:acetyl-CoA carboxylase biotin carboxyl carrier protein